MTAALWVGLVLSGGLGAVARLLMEHGVRRQLAMTFPIGTVMVNISGALLLGLLTGLTPSHQVAILLGTGFLGAYTTFSGWMLETRSLAEQKHISHAAANIAVSVVIGLAAAAAGYWLGGIL